MEKYGRKNLENIKTIIQKETGIWIGTGKDSVKYKSRHTVLLAVCLLLVLSLSAFAYSKFSGLNGDELSFDLKYEGEGKFEIAVTNFSWRELKFQDKIKIMQWSTGEEIAGDSSKISMECLTIAPNSQGTVLIDISEGYDVGAMKENLTDGDWYYFVLTNNNFVFGQDWMCSFDLQEDQGETVKYGYDEMQEIYEQREREKKAAENVPDFEGTLVYTDWRWPSVGTQVSVFYGEQSNGKFSDHINIKGIEGDEIYAVADGAAAETGFNSVDGNFAILDLGNGITVKYGHLKDIKVVEKEEVNKGQIIGTLGKSGTATGPNLSLTVMADGETINPLAEISEQ